MLFVFYPASGQVLFLGGEIPHSKKGQPQKLSFSCLFVLVCYVCSLSIVLVTTGEISETQPLELLGGGTLGVETGRARGASGIGRGGPWAVVVHPHDLGGTRAYLCGELAFIC